MGVPKFFRWISERYPKINQPIHCPPNPATREAYFPSENNEASNVNDADRAKRGDAEDNLKMYSLKNSILPEFDRLYFDMNGIVSESVWQQECVTTFPLVPYLTKPYRDRIMKYLSI